MTFISRKCIIDKNVKIGKDVIIMNKEVNKAHCSSSFSFYIVFNLTSICMHALAGNRVFKKEIDQKKGSIFALESSSYQRRLQ